VLELAGTFGESGASQPSWYALTCGIQRAKIFGFTLRLGIVVLCYLRLLEFRVTNVSSSVDRD
jgi:hypothetical protein